jgi:hypothetical protein
MIGDWLPTRLRSSCATHCASVLGIMLTLYLPMSPSASTLKRAKIYLRLLHETLPDDDLTANS